MDQLTADQQTRVRAFIQERAQEIVDFTAALVRAPSMNPPGDERAAAAVALEWMGRLGLQGAEVWARTEERPNIVFRLPGRSGGKTLMLSGHLDTRPIGELREWRSDPHEPTIRDGKMFGLGSSDMKGAVAAMIYATAALAASGQELGGDVLLAFTADEETGSGAGAQYLVRERGLRADAALIGEPQSIHEPFESLPLVSRTGCSFMVRIFGTQGHSSVSDRIHMVNAIQKMAWVLDRMAREWRPSFAPHPLCSFGPTVNVGMIVRGGVSFGIYPGFAEFGVEVRTIPGMTPEAIRADAESFLQALAAEDADLKWEFAYNRDPSLYTQPTVVSEDEPLVRHVLDAAEQVLGRRLPFTYFPGGTDAKEFQGFGGVPTLPGFGPGLLTVAHGPNEFVHIHALAPAAEVYALTAMAYLRNGE
ncbi:MAG: M20 family metallopeptidase [Chloroflexota bacterium]